MSVSPATIIVGSRVILRCSVVLRANDDTGTHLFDFAWHRENIPVHSGSRINISSNQTSGYSILILSTVNTNDKLFTCLARARDISNQSMPSDYGRKIIILHIIGKK